MNVGAAKRIKELNWKKKPAPAKKKAIKPASPITSMTGLNKLVSALVKQFNYCKINLIYAEGVSEGVWCVPVTKEDSRKLRGDSSGEFAFVRLMNASLGWNHLTWGGLIKVITNGNSRATARLADQTDAILLSDRENLQALVTAFYNKRLARKKVKR